MFKFELYEICSCKVSLYRINLCSYVYWFNGQVVKQLMKVTLNNSTMDTVRNCDIYINIPLSETYNLMIYVTNNYIH
jgi:hypothetical protein